MLVFWINPIYFMKAATYHRYGHPSVVGVTEVQKPVVRRGELLVKVYATAVTVADVRIRSSRFPRGFGLLGRLIFGITRPRRPVLGSFFSGVVEDLATDVKSFAVGDEVCGSTGTAMGAHAEYIVMKATKAVVQKPSEVSHTDAAGILFGATAALYFLRDAVSLKLGQRILINGASGAVGTSAIQLAHYYGTEVTVVSNTKNAELLKQLGATNIIGHSELLSSAPNLGFDYVLDTAGNLTPKNEKQLLAKDGKMILMVASLSEMLFGGKNVVRGVALEKADDITFLLDLMKEKKLIAVIDSVFTLDEIREAHARAESREKVGSVVVKVV